MWLRSFKVLHRVRPRGELTCDVRTHFVAARADRRSNCGDQVGWSRSVELTELLNRLFDYASRRPPPPSMNRRNGLRASIYQQDRYAVGGSDTDRLTGLDRSPERRPPVPDRPTPKRSKPGQNGFAGV